MKKMIAACAFLALTHAQAEELKFGDLNYLIPQSKLNLSASSDFRSETMRTVGVKTETEGWYFNTLATYGLSERLNLFAGLNYQYNVEVTNKTIPSDSRFSQDGLANPVVGALYRLLKQDESAFNLDVGAVGRIQIEKDKYGNASGPRSKDGNAALRNSLEVFGRVGNKWNEANEWQLTAGALHHFAGESTGLNVTGPKSEFDHEPSTDLYVRAAYQYRPVHEFMMVISAQATQVGEQEVESEANVKSKADPHLDFDFSFTAKYLITTNFIANFSYGLGRNSDYDVKSDAGNSEVDKRRDSRIGVGVDFLF